MSNQVVLIAGAASGIGGRTRKRGRPPEGSPSLGCPCKTLLILLVNACHAAALTASIAPSRSVVSRTITPASDATSTHCPPVDPL